MSTVKVQGNAGGTGSITLASPNTNNNRTINLPDVDGTVVTADSSGNVGIGTSSPTEKLHIVSSASQTNIRLANSGSNNGYIGYDSSANMIFYTAGTEKTRIDTSGNLLVGTTSALFGANTFTRSGNAAVAINRDGSDGVTLAFGRASSLVGNVAVTSSSTSYNTSSDYRLKENIQPMTGALARVAALKPCTYTWKIDDSDGEGFIAHELAQVVPQCVTGEKDAVDADGNPVYQGIDTSFLVATLTAAIQELNAKVDAQAAEIAALKGGQ